MNMLIREIYARMFQPYFLNPLRFYAYGERGRVRSRIENTTLNAATSTISLRECFPKRRRIVRSTVRFIKVLISERRAYAKLNVVDNIRVFYTDMLRHVNSMPVAVDASGYSSYYSDKGENQDWHNHEHWNAKQKSVHNALNNPEICTVLDVACNTGWYALMAAQMGKSVVAFDIDESCIETLYQKVRDVHMNVLPLVMNFTQLTPDRYAIHDGNRVLISAVERLRSDSVLALGIIHHLVLGLGMNFEDLLDSLVPLCKKQMVIEFVDPNDAMIQGEPSFFPAYFKDKSLISDYDLQTLIALIEVRGFVVSVCVSYPVTRKILVCHRLVQ